MPPRWLETFRFCASSPPLSRWSRRAKMQSRAPPSLAADMVSRESTIDSPSKFRMWPGEQSSQEDAGNLSNRINQLRKQIQAERMDTVKEKFGENGKKVESYVSQLLQAASGNYGLGGILHSRTDNPLCKFSGFSQGLEDKDGIYSHEVVLSSVTKLPFIEKLPPYTTWIFLDRNQRMAEDQSVVGRRRIYYDQHGSETLICSDSEEEIAEPDEVKHDYSEGEDRLIWMAIEEYGCSEEVHNIVSQYVGGTALEIQERYKLLQQQYHQQNNQNAKDPVGLESGRGITLEKTLSDALDSFDNLFCRRCLVFDCRLHGCSQSIIHPSEKLPYSFEHETDGKPCSDQCYLHLKSIRRSLEGSVIGTIYRRKSKTLKVKEGVSALPDAEEQAASDIPIIIQDERQTPEREPNSPNNPAKDENLSISVTTAHHQEIQEEKAVEQEDVVAHDSNVISDDLKDYPSKRQRTLAPLVNPETELQTTIVPLYELQEHTSEHGVSDGAHNDRAENVELDEANNAKHGHDETPGSCRDQDIAGDEAEIKLSSIVQLVQLKPNSSEWKPIEKELYMKGLEIFGRNSCLIARNMLSGLKTCGEVSSYMHDGGASMPHRSIAASNSLVNDNGDDDMNYTEQEMPTRTRLIRKRGRTRKLKYSWKSAGHPSMWKRIADGKNRSCKQYTPCGCQSMCGKECPCLDNGTCCEKYCGCSKSCKNRFRGCHCAKSQCRSRQCPCFAAGRECDPDVCRNCWVSCGDGSLGEPPRRGDGQCGNMRLLLRQQQRILLAKSDVAGWGAFLKKPVNKNDYLGEYTGELISHREADKRGKIYDRANSSFLFDLNDQFVLDAYRKGDKLKFANHSSNPNCYAKVMLVAGDHRVGIFAKEHIEASEELFYDYRYGPDQAPAWARKPETSKTRDDQSVSQGRAKKHQSH